MLMEPCCVSWVGLGWERRGAREHWEQCEQQQAGRVYLRRDDIARVSGEWTAEGWTLQRPGERGGADEG